MVLEASLAFLLLAASPLEEPAREAPNPVFHVPPGRLEPDELWFIAEIAEGSARKHEFRTATGKRILDRVLCPRPVPGGRTIHGYPASYGFSPGRFNVDRDPLDLLVLGSAETYRSLEDRPPAPRRVRAIGVLLMEECEDGPCSEVDWLQDWKVLAVDVEDAALREARGAELLPAAIRERLAEFFSHYKGSRRSAETGKDFPTTRVAGFRGRAEALRLLREEFPLLAPVEREREIARGRRLFEEALSRNDERPALDPAYLDALQRVPHAGFLPGSPSFRFFLRHDACQLLLSLGEEGVTPASALERMEARRRAGKKHYRFVGRDVPAPPGTGDAIFEWVKTEPRNEGCPEGFPPQHYQSRPLVDVDPALLGE